MILNCGSGPPPPPGSTGGSSALPALGCFPGGMHLCLLPKDCGQVEGWPRGPETAFDSKHSSVWVTLTHFLVYFLTVNSVEMQGSLHLGKDYVQDGVTL